MYTDKCVYEFLAEQQNNPIVERKTCRLSGTQFPIYESDTAFYKKITFNVDGKKFHLPLPSLCPEERQRRRLLIRNERHLFKTTCAASKKSIVSMYSPDKEYIVYDQNVWRSEVWDAGSYGRSFDFSQTFTEQYDSLLRVVPKYSLSNRNHENSAYCNRAINNKNCYLLSSAMHNQSCSYGNIVHYCSDSYDLYKCQSCSLCYDCSNCKTCHQVYYATDCISCTKCAHISYCSNLTSCMFCFGLHNKQYYFLNEVYSKDEYTHLIERYRNNEAFRKECLEKYKQVISEGIHPSTDSTGSSFVSGNEIYNSNNILLSYDIRDGQNIAYSSICIGESHDCYDVTSILSTNLSYESISVVNQSNCIVTYGCRDSDHILYSEAVFNSSHCFGCVGLRYKKNCIMNKQYSKQEYEVLLGKIIHHMQETGERGEFFDPSLSAFGYNETIAQEYFPLSQNDAKHRNYKRNNTNYDPKVSQHTNTLQGNDIPKNIKDVTDDILSKVLVCALSGRPFKIHTSELAFYRTHHILLPTTHPDIRHQQRINERLPRNMFLRTCNCCDNTILSVYNTGNSKTIYCPECYQRAIFE